MFQMFAWLAGALCFSPGQPLLTHLAQQPSLPAMLPYPSETEVCSDLKYTLMLTAAAGSGPLHQTLCPLWASPNLNQGAGRAI